LRVLDTGEAPRAGSRERRSRALRISPYRPGPLGFQPGAFDAALVPEVAALGSEAPDRLTDLARVVEGRLLLVGTAAEGGVAYETLYAWLSERFEHVRIFGEAPFEGVAVADFEAGSEPEVVVDGTLAAAGRGPRAFYALASDAPIEDLPGYTVVELPSALTPDVAVEAPAQRVDVDLEAAVEHAEELEAEVERLRRALEEAQEARKAAAAREARAREGGDASAEATREIEALEARLVERARHVRDLEAEVERRGLLVRDAVEEARELRRLGGGDPNAVERALAAEAARAEAQFQVDELRAQLRECMEGRAGATPTEGLEGRAGASEAELDRLELREAELTGRVRGLRSRLLEQNELYQLALSRLSLAEATLGEREEAQLHLERELAEAQDQLELALVQARGRLDGDAYEQRIRELTASEERLSARVGELSNQLVAAQDLAASLEARAPSSNEELERRDGRELGLRLRLGNVERAFAARAVQARRGVAAIDTVDQLRTEVAAVRAENSALTIQLADLRAAEGELRARAGDQTSALAARDALVTRLQLELSQLEQQVRRAEQRASRLEDETKSLRAAMVDAASAVEARERADHALEDVRRELDELRARARRFEADRAELEGRAQRTEGERVELADRVVRLADERAELEGRVSELEAELRERAAASSEAQAPAADERLLSMEAELEVLRAHAEALESERDDARALLAETREALEGLRSGRALGDQAPPPGEGGSERRDRDLLFRSLTAQLEERNDRIRALERRLAGSIPAAPPDDELMKRQLLELQERSVRLAEELAAERDARRTVESRLVHYESRPELDEALGRAQEELGRFRHELDLEKGRADGFERDVLSLREVCVEARNGLESLLGEATSSGDQATADRIGRLLTVLGRY
jgi:chromosome segregation ATPase